MSRLDEISERALTTVEVTAAVGASYRQLDYWAAHGYINGQPTQVGSGQVRRWRDPQVEEARWLAKAARAFMPSGYVDLVALATFVRRAAAAGVRVDKQ